METRKSEKAVNLSVEAIMAQLFHPSRYRTPRSDEYKAGIRAVLEYRIHGVCMTPPPWQVGTAQADAYFAGTDEGHRVWRSLREDAAS